MKKAVQFNPLAAEFRRDPYPIYARLRQEDPVHRNVLGAWVLTRYEDVSAVLRDGRFGAHSISAGIRNKKRLVEGVDLDILADACEQWLMLLNPPDHTRIRKLVSRPFTPSSMKAFRPRVQGIVDELVARARPLGRIDLVNDLAVPLAVGMIAEMLGVPEDGKQRVLAWTDGLTRLLDPLRSLEEYVEMNRVAGEFSNYFRELFEQRRAAPQDDLISALVSGGEQATEKELLSVCMLLFASGEKTTVNLIGNGMLALMSFPDQLAALRRAPDSVPDAIQELLRYDSPVQLSTRVPSEAIVVGGKTIGAGELVFLALGAANRDPDRFEDPDTLDLQREDNRHLAFSGGIHYCLGAALAQLEGDVAFRAILESFDELELQTEAIEWQREVIFRGPRALPVTFTAVVHSGAGASP
jgi:cytochrome P450